MENRRNYYRILHVQPDAPVEVIRASFRTLMQRLKVHPDLGGDSWHAALINEARGVLTDRAKRAAYDRNRESRFPPFDVGVKARRYSTASRVNAQLAGALRCPFCRAVDPRDAPVLPDLMCVECGSPLHPADGLRLEHDDQRAVRRINRQHTVTFLTTWPADVRHVGVTRDVSLNGMQFDTASAPAEGQLLKLDCDLCSAVARVVNRRRKRIGVRPVWAVGVEFITLRFATNRGVFLSARA